MQRRWELFLRANKPRLSWPPQPPSKIRRSFRLDHDFTGRLQIHRYIFHRHPPPWKSLAYVSRIKGTCNACPIGWHPCETASWHYPGKQNRGIQGDEWRKLGHRCTSIHNYPPLSPLPLKPNHWLMLNILPFLFSIVYILRNCAKGPQIQFYKV